MIGSIPGAGWTRWPTTLAGSGATVFAASFAGWIALAATQSIASRRQDDLERADRARREVAYDELLSLMTTIFTKNGATDAQEARIRAKVAIWGDECVTAAVADWNGITYRIMSENEGNLDEASRHELLNQYYVVYEAVIHHLRREKATPKDVLLRMVFSNYEPEEPTPR